MWNSNQQIYTQDCILHQKNGNIGDLYVLKVEINWLGQRLCIVH